MIEYSQSPWASPVCLIKKKDDTYRFCVDYRRVNSISKKDAFSIPDIHDALDHLRLVSYYRRFVKGFATIAEPLTRLTKKHTPFHWSPEADHAFERSFA